MIKPKYLTLLHEHHAGDHYHSNRCLLDHLIGTYELLVQRENPETVCVAGLFHSIYGVETEQCKPDRFDQRNLVRTVIGEPAEQLVYLFCSLERGSYLTRRANQPEYQALIEIEVANIIEQAPHIDHFFKETLGYIDKLKQVMDLLILKGTNAFQSFLTTSPLVRSLG